MSTLRDALRDLSDTVFFDLLESDDAYLVVMDVPGASPETLSVTVDGGEITIEANREKGLPTEYRYLEENRSLFVDAILPLPDDATETGARARVDRGVLELRLPKRESAGETSIDIEGADDGGYEPIAASPAEATDEEGRGRRDEERDRDVEDGISGAGSEDETAGESERANRRDGPTEIEIVSGSNSMDEAERRNGESDEARDLTPTEGRDDERNRRSGTGQHRETDGNREDTIGDESDEGRGSNTRSDRRNGDEDTRSNGDEDTRSNGDEDARSNGDEDARSNGDEDARSNGDEDTRSNGREES